MDTGDRPMGKLETATTPEAFNPICEAIIEKVAAIRVKRDEQEILLRELELQAHVMLHTGVHYREFAGFSFKVEAIDNQTRTKLREGRVCLQHYPTQKRYAATYFNVMQDKAGNEHTFPMILRPQAKD